MLDMSSLQAAATSLQTAGSIVKAILDLRDVGRGSRPSHGAEPREHCSKKSRTSWVASGIAPKVRLPGSSTKLP
jgi:hypothetical protein